MFKSFSSDLQAGLRSFCLAIHHDDLLPADLSPESWAWLYFQLEAAYDNPEWFPKGKWATLQAIHMRLTEAAKELIGARGLDA